MEKHYILSPPFYTFLISRSISSSIMQVVKAISGGEIVLDRVHFI